MIITLDAMGGDHAPEAAVHGGVWAARDFGVCVQLVGQEAIIQAELAKHNTEGLDLPILPASEVIEMDDHPSQAAKTKKDSSMIVGLKNVASGQSHAFISAGNSGGVLASSLFTLKRIGGIKRPALSTVFPTQSDHGFCFLLDVGANTEVKAEYLYQFAIMGSLYTERVLGIDRPRVGIVSTGEEEGKGNQLVLEASDMMRQAPINFVGNIEGRDIPNGLADVVVTDGFTGNVIIKLSEGVANFIVRTIENEIKTRPLAMVGAAFGYGAIRSVRKKLDYREYGGGALLGVNGVVIITHGSSDAYTIRNAVRVAMRSVEQNIIHAIQDTQNKAKVSE